MKIYNQKAETQLEEDSNSFKLTMKYDSEEGSNITECGGEIGTGESAKCTSQHYDKDGNPVGDPINYEDVEL